MYLKRLSSAFLFTQVAAFAPSFKTCDTKMHQNVIAMASDDSSSDSGLQTRTSFLATSTSAILASGIFLNPSPTYARGRATLEFSYDRYGVMILYFPNKRVLISIFT